MLSSVSRLGQLTWLNPAQSRDETDSVRVCYTRSFKEPYDVGRGLFHHLAFYGKCRAASGRVIDALAS